MPFSISPHKKVILVIDNDLSTYRGILRICPVPETEVHHFNNRELLFAWLRQHYGPLAYGHWACCLVIDTNHAEICDENSFDAVWMNCAKIYLSRQFRDIRLFRNVKIGAPEFMQKPFKLDVMKATLARLFSLHSGRTAINQKFKQLTKRELETCQLMVQGLSTQEIAIAMGISIKTVKVHRANLMGKTKAKSVADLIRDYDAFTSFSSHASSISGANLDA